MLNQTFIMLMTQLEYLLKFEGKQKLSEISSKIEVNPNLDQKKTNQL